MRREEVSGTFPRVTRLRKESTGSEGKERNTNLSSFALKSVTGAEITASTRTLAGRLPLRAKELKLFTRELSSHEPLSRLHLRSQSRLCSRAKIVQVQSFFLPEDKGAISCPPIHSPFPSALGGDGEQGGGSATLTSKNPEEQAREEGVGSTQQMSLYE